METVSNRFDPCESESFIALPGLLASTGTKKAAREEDRKEAAAATAEQMAPAALMEGGAPPKQAKGMKKWIAEYQAKRPRPKVLQAHMDAFMADHNARKKKARRERLAEAAEDGWTVVVGSKGWKRTAHAESGIRVGAVSVAAIAEKAAAKAKLSDKSMSDFYCFQWHESRRNVVCSLSLLLQWLWKTLHLPLFVIKLVLLCQVGRWSRRPFKVWLRTLGSPWGRSTHRVAGCHCRGLGIAAEIRRG